MSEYIWPDSKEDVNIIENFGDRLPQQENGSDCGLFMLEFMFRAYYNFNRLTDYLDNHKEQTGRGLLFDSELIQSRRKEYCQLVNDLSELRGDN